MKGYIHKGEIETSGIVDFSLLITDAAELEVFPSDDSFRLINTEKGNFEWWYFDIIDADTNCILKLVAHLGTDPLRKRFFPQVVISVKTPTLKRSLIKHFALNDFRASREFCDVWIKDEFHAFLESPSKGNIYRLTANVDDFRAEITFIPEIEGWKPLGNNVKIKKGKKEEFLYMN